MISKESIPSATKKTLSGSGTLVLSWGSTFFEHFSVTVDRIDAGAAFTSHKLQGTNKLTADDAWEDIDGSLADKATVHGTPNGKRYARYQVEIVGAPADTEVDYHFYEYDSIRPR